MGAHENGNYSWLDLQAWNQFLAELRKTGKDFAWHMAEWFGPDEAAKIAKPLIAGGKGLAVIGFGAGQADNIDDLARAHRSGKLPRWDGKKPSYSANPDHVPGTLRPGKHLYLTMHRKYFGTLFRMIRLMQRTGSAETGTARFTVSQMVTTGLCILVGSTALAMAYEI